MTRSRLLMLVMGGWLAATIPVRADVPTEKSLPGSTIFYLKIADVKALRAAVGETAIGQILADPALKPIMDQLEGEMAKDEAEVKEKLGMTLREALALPEGTVVVALTARDDPKTPSNVIVSVDAGSNAGKMAELTARLTKSSEETSKIRTEEFEGLKLTVLESTKEGEDKGPSMAWAQSGSVFHFASDAAVIKDLVANAKGRSDSLASSENYQAVLKQVGEAPQVFFYGDIAQVFKLATATSANQGVNAEQIEAQLQGTGLSGLKSIGVGLNFNSGEYDYLMKAYVHAPGPLQGVLKLFSMPKAELKPEPWVPATVASYATYSLDFDALWDGAKELADQFAPGVLENLEQQLGGDDGKGLSFKKDIFAPLGSRVSVIADYKKPINDKSQRMLVAIKLDDSKAFQGTMNKLIAIAMAQPKKREFQGTTIYDFEIPEEMAQAGAGAISGPISVAIANDALLISTEPALLEQVLRPGGSGLADNADYLRVAKRVPSATSIFSFERSDENARVLYEMVKSGQLQKSLEEANQAAGADAPKIDFDWSKLPDFDVFAKYLSQAGGYSEITENGMLTTSFSLKKAAR